MTIKTPEGKKRFSFLHKHHTECNSWTNLFIKTFTLKSINIKSHIIIFTKAQKCVRKVKSVFKESAWIPHLSTCLRDKALCYSLDWGKTYWHSQSALWDSQRNWSLTAEIDHPLVAVVWWPRQIITCLTFIRDPSFSWALVWAWFICINLNGMATLLILVHINVLSV